VKKFFEPIVLSILALFCVTLVAWGCFLLLQDTSSDFLFNAMLQARPKMAYGFALMFLLGLFIIMERLWFFVERLPFFIKLVSSAIRKKRMFTTESRTEVVKGQLDGYEPDFGAGLLEFIAGIAPVLGFICTLIGFMMAFDRLGVGMRLVNVLSALSYSMITSLLGAAISLLFLIVAFLLRRIRTLFDLQFQ